MLNKQSILRCKYVFPDQQIFTVSYWANYVGNQVFLNLRNGLYKSLQNLVPISNLADDQTMINEKLSN